jgi:hypothetical protein
VATLPRGTSCFSVSFASSTVIEVAQVWYANAKAQDEGRRDQSDLQSDEASSTFLMLSAYLSEV